MNAAALMQEIRTLPETEKAELMDVLIQEEREALLDRLEQDQDAKEAAVILNDPTTEWVPWDEVKRTMAWE